MKCFNYEIEGVVFTYRSDTWDLNIAKEVIEADYYGLRSLRQEGGVPKNIVDVGAHLGYFSLYCRELWPESIIHSYEANPDNFTYLEDNVYSQVKSTEFTTTPYRMAMCGDPDKEWSKLVKPWALGSAENTGGGTINDNTDVRKGVSVVRACTIEHSLDIMKSIDLLKFDCEGSEAEILEYARQKGLMKYIGWIRGEYHGTEQLNRMYKALDASHQMAHEEKASEIGFFIAHRTI